MKRIRGIISKIRFDQFSVLWVIVAVPILALIVNVILAEAQNSFGMINIIVSIIFLIILFFEIIFIYRRLFLKDIERMIFPRFEVAFNQQPQDARGYEYLFEESIISDKRLSEFESTCTCEEIWVVSNDLETEVDGGLYAEVVPSNLRRGIKYKMFVPKNYLTTMRLEQLKRRNENSENIEYYLLTDDFFFLVSKLDFTIYDPYKTSATGRRGYIGLDLPDCEELYAARIDDPLIDAIASKLLEYIQAKKFEQY